VRQLLAPVVIVGLTVSLGFPAQEKKIEVATDPDKAGPDFAIQGEYFGDVAGKTRLGAEVIARGGGKFQVNFLPGGLRSEGGDYSKHVPASAVTAGDLVTVTSKDGKWTGTISNGHLRGKTDKGDSFSLDRIVRKSRTLGAQPPPGGVVLFDGKNTNEWPDKSQLVDGNLLGSDIASKRKFGDHRIHLEFRLSFMPYKGGQQRSNSGVYVQHRYEIQVLDSFGLKGADNECGGIYSQSTPLVNLCYPPLTWQTYDIEFKAARFDPQTKKKVANAVITVWHNGVLIHDKVALSKGPTGGGIKEDGTPGPLFLQGHGGQVQYRNIWVVETKEP
jgi:hypothetical protein